MMIFIFKQKKVYRNDLDDHESIMEYLVIIGILVFYQCV